jgi:sterol desaturase/sphingolipid hydroxylase (fatty acid hydroxylase superfamily)
MIDRIMALIGLLMLGAFLVVVPIFVPHLDLIAVIVGCGILATYDMWRHVVGKHSG